MHDDGTEKAMRMGQLLLKEANGTLTESEAAELAEWLQLSEEYRRVRSEFLHENDENPHFNGSLHEYDADLALKKLMTTHTQKHSPRIHRLRWMQLVAALLVAGTGIYFVLKNTGRPDADANHAVQAIEAGSNKATLRLASGVTINLSSEKSTVVIHHNRLQYNDASPVLAGESGKNDLSPDTAETTYNTLSTPRGGQYQIILPDGSHIWLNAASSLTYPSAFNRRERSVELTGEGYFEVSQRDGQPFKVVCNGQIIEVLGTRFNVMSYQDEPFIKTTLLDGSVRIRSGDASQVLIPGQEAETDRAGIRISKDIDMTDALAWKNGYFMFSNEPIESVMRKIARWYNVDVVYEGNMKGIALWGSMSRFKEITAVLKTLELTKAVHFKISNRTGERRIIVTN